MNQQRSAQPARDLAMSRLQIIVCTVTVFLNALDGFDLLAISFATPGIMKDFGLKASTALGVRARMDLLGMALGSFALGGHSRSVWTPPAILTFLVVMAVGMYGCSHADNREWLAAWRFWTGLGHPAECWPPSMPPRPSSPTTGRASSGWR
jgi:MFS family permease